MKKKIFASLIVLILSPIVLLCGIWGYHLIQYKISDYRLEKIITERSANRICFTSSYSIKLKADKVVTELDGQEWDISNFRKYGLGDDGEFIAVIIDTNNTIQDVFSVIHTTAKKHTPLNKNCMELQ